MHAIQNQTESFNDQDEAIKLPQAVWLLPESTVSKLWIIDDIETRNSKPAQLDLDVTFTDGTNLQDPVNRHWLDLTIKYVFKLRNGHNSEIKTAQKHAAASRVLLIFLQWLRLNGFYRLKDIKPSVTNKFHEEISYGFGYALKYKERMQNYFSSRTKDQIPTYKSPHAKNRVMVDKLAILNELNINHHSLAADKVASAYMRSCIEGIGYEKKGSLKEIPEYRPLIKVTQKRYMNSVRALYI